MGWAQSYAEKGRIQMVVGAIMPERTKDDKLKIVKAD